MAVVELHAVHIGIHTRSGCVNAPHAGRKQRIGLSRRGLGIEHAATHKRPRWLVVVHVRRLDDGDAELRAASAQAGRHSDTGSTAAKNEHVTVDGRQ